MARKPQVEDDKSIDQTEVDAAEVAAVTDNEVAPSPFEEVGEQPEELAEEVAYEPAERREWRGAIAELHGTTDELHSIQVRFAEMLQFLPGAIAKSEGEVKRFLQSLHQYL